MAIQRTSRIKWSILHIKCNSACNYIQGSCFPKQSFDQPYFLFKMSTHGFGSGVELVRRMIEGDLITSWVMFDHVKRVHHWTTMGAHVYDHFCCCLLTIVLCEMKAKDLES
jgi:hypothetical protein